MSNMWRCVRINAGAGPMLYLLFSLNQEGSLIRLNNVTKIYRVGGSNVVALDGVDLHVKKGDIHGIVGQSGAGKSTLIRCLTALERPTSGNIIVDGVDMTTLKASQLRQARRSIGMVFQQANLLEGRTAGANIAYPMQIAKADNAQINPRVGELLEVVGLGDRADSYPAQLSGGQQQRIGIARAMATNPPVLLCDEPTSALDTESTKQVLGLLKELRDKSGVTIVVITHEMGVVTEICDSVTLLRAGQVVQSGTVSDVLSDVGSPLSEALIPAPVVEPSALRPQTRLLDVSFTSTPGVPTGATVLGLLASLGADIASGRFESVGELQVGRLAVSVPDYHCQSVLTELKRNGVAARERAA